MHWLYYFSVLVISECSVETAEGRMLAPGVYMILASSFRMSWLYYCFLAANNVTKNNITSQPCLFIDRASVYLLLLT